MDHAAAQAFVRANTQALAVPSLPEIKLYQADEVTPLWLMTEAELAINNLSPPFWAFAWAGGQALSLYLQNTPQVVAGKRVFDLACGSGLVGIAAAKAGASHVTANDIDPFAGAAVTLNADLNGVEITFDGTDRLSGSLPDVDVILAGDICYERTMSEAMLTFLRRAFDKGIEVYIGDPHRSYFPKSGLDRVAQYTVLTPADIEDTSEKPASVWKMI